MRGNRWGGRRDQFLPEGMAMVRGDAFITGIS